MQSLVLKRLRKAFKYFFFAKCFSIYFLRNKHLTSLQFCYPRRKFNIDSIICDSQHLEFPEYLNMSLKARCASHPEYNPGPCIVLDCRDSNIFHFTVPASVFFFSFLSFTIMTFLRIWTNFLECFSFSTYCFFFMIGFGLTFLGRALPMWCFLCFPLHHIRSHIVAYFSSYWWC